MSADGMITIKHKSLSNQQIALYGKYSAGAEIHGIASWFHRYGWQNRSDQEIADQLAKTLNNGITVFEHVLSPDDNFCSDTRVEIDFDSRFVTFPLSTLYNWQENSWEEGDDKIDLILSKLLPFLAEESPGAEYETKEAMKKNIASWMEIWSEDQQPDYEYRIPFDQFVKVFEFKAKNYV